jgi:phosphate transport system substrate-binding protein
VVSINCALRGLVAGGIVSLIFLSTTPPVRAQQEIDVCLKSGVVIRALRVEAHDNKFSFYPQGGGAPIEVAENLVKGIGVPCDGATQPSPASAAAATLKFGIHGSNTIGERLMPLLIDTFSQKKYGARAIVRQKAPEVSEIEIRPANSAQPIATIDFQAKGSGTSEPSLVDKQAEIPTVIGMSSRRANDKEVKEVHDLFNIDLLTAGNEHVLALDGIPVIVNPGNPIRQLSLEQIAKIFSGEISNWRDVTYLNASGQEVPGPDLPIKVHARDNKSGTYDTFVNLVLAPPDQPKRQLTPQAARYESSENLSDAVAKDPGAIGFIGFPYIKKNTALLIASSCGMLSAPSKFTVKTESYPLARRLYLYTLGEPNIPMARDIMQFAMSDEAQPTIIEGEFIDQAVEFQDANDQRQWRLTLMANPSQGLASDKTVAVTTVRSFDAALQKLRRSTVVFRFDYGSSTLDAKVVDDVGRLARYLQSPGIAGKRFELIGFADSSGNWSSNLQLSTDRAQRVANELKAHGAAVPDGSVLGMSYMAPVACNDGPAGQAKNRRVEVWIAP